MTSLTLDFSHLLIKFNKLSHNCAGFSLYGAVGDEDLFFSQPQVEDINISPYNRKPNTNRLLSSSFNDFTLSCYYAVTPQALLELNPLDGKRYLVFES